MPSKQSNIILIGMPGSGKSAIGSRLARMASMSFIDTDSLIRLAEGRSLQDIVDGDGHMALRHIEEEVLLKLACQGHVIATGGSAVYSHRGMEHLRALGTIVYLHVDLVTLELRIQDYETRGLAKAPGQTLEDLLHERAPLYDRYADVTIESGGLEPDEVSRAIVDALRRRGFFSSVGDPGGFNQDGDVRERGAW